MSWKHRLESCMAYRKPFTYRGVFPEKEGMGHWRGKWNPSGISERKRGVKYRWGKKKGLRRARRRYGLELIRAAEIGQLSL